jgi:hypothetical protein
MVVLHLLTQQPYAALLGDTTLAPFLEAAVAPGQFGFTVYADTAEQRQATNGLASRLAAYEALYADVLTSLGPVATLRRWGTPTAIAVCAQAGPISVALFNSPLRHRIPWAPGDPRDRLAYMWWFITVEPPFHDAAKRYVEDVAGMAARFVYTRGLMTAETRQQRTHYHGILWCAIAVTRAYVRACLGQQAQLIKIEPMRTGPAAAYTYIVNQQLTGVWYWPQPSIALWLRTSQCAFQAQLARPGPRSARQWQATFDVAVAQGTPWYTMKSATNALPCARVRAGLRLKSRAAAIIVTRTWQITLATYTATDWAAQGYQMAVEYGIGAFRQWSHDVRRWAGQPVIITYTDAEDAAAQAYLSGRGWPISHIIRILPDP